MVATGDGGRIQSAVKFVDDKAGRMKVIITGTTGMVGEGVLLECLASPMVLEEGDEKLHGYDACFFCAGVSSVGMKEPEFKRITYDTTLTFARAVGPASQMSFIYVSGGGTDSSEKGRMMWARVKGKTENDLMKLPFKQVFAFRPGFMVAIPGQKRVLAYYKYISWLFPAIKVVLPNIITTLQQVGQAMITAARQGYEKNIVEVKDIKILAGRELH